MRKQQVGIAVAGAVLAVSSFSTAAGKPVTLKSPEERLIAPLNVASLNRLTTAALGGTPSATGFIAAFDRRLDTQYEAKENGPAHLDVVFSQPQTIHSLRLLLGDGQYRWSFVTADSL